MKYSSFIRMGVVMVSTVFLAHEALAKPQHQIQLEGLTVTMSLIKRTPNVNKIDWPTEPASLTTESVAVRQKTIHQLLSDAHIFPDVEAFTVVYALNPNIEALREIRAPQIRIPKVAGGPQLQAAFAEGAVVLLTVDQEKKENFNANVQKFKQLTEQVSKFEPQKFEGVPTRQTVIDSLSSTSAILAAINQRLTQRFGRPISNEGLGQLDADVKSLNTMLSDKLGPTAKIVECDADKILAIERDVILKGRAFNEVAAGDAPDAPPNVLVVVKTLKAGNAVPNLRVYYVPEALRDNEHEVRAFGALSSPTDKKIPEADYCFWAAIDPTQTPVTNVLCYQIRRADRAEIQLVVIR